MKNYFANIGTDLASKIPDDTMEEQNHAFPSVFYPTEVTYDDVVEEVNKLKICKSWTYDSIMTKFIKYTGDDNMMMALP